MRIANNTLVAEIERYLNYNRNEVSEKYVQISSGKKYLKRSDDPVATYEIANIEARNDRSDQWEQNLKRAISWEMASEARLDNVLTAMQRCRELMVESNSGTLNPGDQQNISVEINEMIESLVSELNSDFAGTPMYAGAGIRPSGHVGHWNEATFGSPPSAGDPSMPVDWEDLTEAQYNTWHTEQCTGTATAWTATSLTDGGGTIDWSNLDLTGAKIRITGGTGAGQVREITSSTNDTVNVSENWTTMPDGTSTFEIIDFSPGWVDPSGKTFSATRDSEGNIITVTYNGSDNSRKIQVSDYKTTSDYGTVGSDIVNFESLEKNPTPPPDWVYNDVNMFDTLIKLREDLSDGNTASDTMVKRNERALDNIVTQVVTNGVSQNKLELMAKNVEISQESGNNWLSELGSLDVAEAITNLNEMEAALQASLQMVPRMNSMRIVDFI